MSKVLKSLLLSTSVALGGCAFDGVLIIPTPDYPRPAPRYPVPHPSPVPQYPAPQYPAPRHPAPQFPVPPNPYEFKISAAWYGIHDTVTLEVEAKDQSIRQVVSGANGRSTKSASNGYSKPFYSEQLTDAWGLTQNRSYRYEQQGYMTYEQRAERSKLVSMYNSVANRLNDKARGSAQCKKYPGEAVKKCHSRPTGRGW